MKKYLAVRLYTRVPEDVILEIIPPEGIFLWHKNAGTKYVYRFEDTNRFYDDFSEVKQTILQKTPVLHPKIDNAQAIIEVNVNESNYIDAINQIYSAPEWQWQPVKVKSLTGNALESINTIYANQCSTEKSNQCVMF